MRRLGIFILVNLVLTCFYLDTRYTPNPMSRALPVLAVFEQHTLQIDKYEKWSNDKAKIGEHYYSDKAPLPTFLVLPFYGLLKMAGLAEVDPARNFATYPISIIGDILCGSIPFVAIMLLTFLAMKVRSARSFVPAELLATLPYYGSFLFIYTGTYFNHLISAAFLLGCYVLLRSARRFALAGTLLGAAVLCEYPVALAIPIFGAQIYVNSGCGALRQFMLGFAPWGVVGCAYNWALTGSLFTTVNAFHADPQFAGMHKAYGFRLPTLSALWGLSFSPFRGLFYYAPVLVLAGFACWKMLRRNSLTITIQSALRHYFVPFSLLFFFTFAAHFTWWGGWCYGPRYLTPIAVVLLYEGIIILSRVQVSRIGFYGLFAFGFIQAAIGKATENYLVPEKYSFPLLDVFLPSLAAGKFNDQNLLSMIFGLNAGAASLVWGGLFGLAVISSVCFSRTGS